jgi:hypothetical protein
VNDSCVVILETDVDFIRVFYKNDHREISAIGLSSGPNLIVIWAVSYQPVAIKRHPLSGILSPVICDPLHFARAVGNWDWWRTFVDRRFGWLLPGLLPSVHQLSQFDSFSCRQTDDLRKNVFDCEF